MRNQIFTLIVLSTLFIGCSNESQKENKTKVEEEILSENITFDLVPKNSTATWERTLDQKPTKQKIKMFGQMVDVDLGAVQLTSNGSITIIKGELIEIKGKVVEANVLFDMTSLSFAKEKDSGLFDVVNYPNSSLSITSFDTDKMEGELTIQDFSKTIEMDLTVSQIDKKYILKGNFIINTLDFPLRKEVKKKDVNKDEIKVNFEIEYLLK